LKGRVDPMKAFRLGIFVCTLISALGALALQGSMPQSAQTPQTPGTASQNPQAPGATPPYTAPQTQPGTMQGPETQTPAGAPQTPPMRSGVSAIDDQVSALTAALNLSGDQQAKVRTILQDQHQQVITLASDTSMSRDAKLQKVHTLRQATIDRVRSTLTNEEQKSKFDSMVQAQNERLREKEQQEQHQDNAPQPK
jgi:hypothetical protein